MSPYMMMLVSLIVSMAVVIWNFDGCDNEFWYVKLASFMFVWVLLYCILAGLSLTIYILLNGKI